MRAAEELIADLAGAILDGRPIDWAAAQSSTDDTNLPLLDELKLLAALANLHRNFVPPSVTKSVSATLSLNQSDIGQRDHWGHLQLLEPIGSGAFGQVYRAWDTRLEREVALKLLAAGSTSARASSVIQEGRLLARVRHANVVTIYGAEQIGNQVGLWMEYVKGRTLNQALEQGASFSATEAVTIGTGLAHAVSAVHKAGLLHRDIKSHNVMLADDGRVVLMDFGTGQPLTDGARAPLAGTPLYMAPELLRDEPASVRSDIYSLGVLLFHLLTGSYPVRGRNVHDLRHAHSHGDRTNIRTARPSVRPKLARIIDRAIDPEPARRYQSAEALAADLAMLTPRSQLKTVARALGVAAAVVLLAWVAVELGSWTIGRASPTRLLLSASMSWLPIRMAGVSPVDHPVIAVLPFTNLSSEPETNLIVDGLTAEILHQLALIDGLQVRSWESSLAVRNSSLEDVRDRLDVNLVLQGQVLWAGTRVRINVQLVKVAEDVTLWSDRFDRELKDVFAIQDDISRAIVNRLQLRLGKGQRRYDINPQAYELYLKARAMADRAGFDDPKQAIYLFNRVIDIDGGFAPAYAGLANAYAWLSMLTYQTGPLKPALAVMRPAAEKAVELDPRLAEAHAAMGWVYSCEREWRAAEDSFARAIALNPSLTSAYTSYTFSTLRPQEKYLESEQWLKLAQQHDPLSVNVGRELGSLYIVAGRYDDAIAILKRVRAIDAELPFVQRDLGRALIFAGRIDEAIPLLKADFRSHYLAHAYVRAGRRSEAEKLYAVHQSYPYRKAVIAAALGNKDLAFEALELMMVDEPHRVAGALTYPEFSLLRGDPRRSTLRRALGLER
jgi:TolB-like protein